MLQLTTPPTSTLLTSAAMVAAEVGADARMVGLIRQASRACENYCDRTFGLATWTETFLNQAYPLVLSKSPIVTVSSITENGSILDPSADYMLDREAGIVGRSVCYAPYGLLTIVVVYSAGYVLPVGLPGSDTARTLPDDIERACLEVYRALWFSGGSSARDPAVRSDNVEGVGSTSYLDPNPNSGGLPILAASLLEPYRRVGL